MIKGELIVKKLQEVIGKKLLLSYGKGYKLQRHWPSMLKWLLTIQIHPQHDDCNSTHWSWT